MTETEEAVARDVTVAFLKAEHDAAILRAERAEAALAALKAEVVEVVGALDAVMSLDHARTCAGRGCDCDLEDTRDHRFRAARDLLAKLKGEG